MSIASELIPDALQLIRDEGAAIVVRRYTETAGSNSWTPGTPTTVDHSCYAVLEPLKVSSSTVNSSAGNSAGSSKIKATVAGLDIAPTQDDRVVIGSAEYAIDKIETVAPDGANTVLYILELQAWAPTAKR